MVKNFNELINSQTPVLVDFSAEWCGPCKMMGPILEQLKSTMGDSVKIIKIDVDNNRELSAQYNIRNVPTIKVFQNGKEKWSGAGVRQADNLAAIIKQSCEVAVS
jgi:thioredoxin 1